MGYTLFATGTSTKGFEVLHNLAAGYNPQTIYLFCNAATLHTEGQQVGHLANWISQSIIDGTFANQYAMINDCPVFDGGCYMLPLRDYNGAPGALGYRITCKWRFSGIPWRLYIYV